MAWKVEWTPEAQAWRDGLVPRDRRRIDKAIHGLEEHGPGLGRPRADSIRGSRYHHMKELRSLGGHLRALFAFDRNRTAVVLVGGDKQGQWDRWYKVSVPIADERLARHQRQTGQEARWRTGERTAGRSR
jgi:hypothetical protein